MCEAFGFNPDNLVETLTVGFVPFIVAGVSNGVIADNEIETWVEQVRTQFSNRVYCEG